MLAPFLWFKISIFFWKVNFYKHLTNCVSVYRHENEKAWHVFYSDGEKLHSLKISNSLNTTFSNYLKESHKRVLSFHRPGEYMFTLSDQWLDWMSRSMAKLANSLTIKGNQTNAQKHNRIWKVTNDARSSDPITARDNYRFWSTRPERCPRLNQA